MMFMMPEKLPQLFVFLTAEDEMKLRAGATVYVDHQMTGKRFFTEVVVSLHKTKDDIVKMIRSIDPTAKIPDHIPEPPPRAGEVKCKACGGSNAPDRLLDGTCIVCWSAEAKRFRAQSN